MATKTQGSTEQALDDLQDYLAGLTFGPGVHHRNLTIFPIFRENGGEVPYVLLETAIERGDAEVKEVSEEGSVPNISIINRGPLPILIPQGETLAGAMQNRVVNATVLVAPDSTFTLPVSCIEQGRWGAGRRTLEPRWFSPIGMRSHLHRTVQKSRAETGRSTSDQNQVWGKVEEYLDSAKAFSPTRDLLEAYRSAEGRLGEYRKRLNLPEKACGFLVAQGEKVLGMDLFDSPATLRRFWKRLSDSYFFEAALQEEKVGKTSEQETGQFVERLQESAQPAKKSLGLGVEIEIGDSEVVGSALWYEGSIRHLVAFAAEESSSPPARRSRDASSGGRVA